jgi:hypothetical protein
MPLERAKAELSRAAIGSGEAAGDAACLGRARQ